MKFGDIVINDWAGEKNPKKVLMFLSKNNKIIQCISRTGKIVWFTDDKDLRLRKSVDSINFANWDKEIK